MKTAAIVASLTVVGSIAYAAGSQGTAGKQPPLMPSGSQAHSMQEEMPQARGLNVSSSQNLQMVEQSGECTIFETPFPQQFLWFTIAHAVPPCFEAMFPPQPLTNPWRITTDANADGTPDHLIAMFRQAESCEWRYSNGTDWYLCNFSVLWLLEATTSGGQTFASVKPVFTLETVIAYVAAQGNKRPVDGYQIVDLIDMDGDRDLDLIVRASTDSARYLLWIENTNSGSHPIAADLNRDGRVDGADLSLLLVSWGQTQ
jgi:hypothetical protein